MKILYLIKRDPGETMAAILDAHRASARVTVVDLRTEKDYAGIVRLIEQNDKVICV